MNPRQTWWLVSVSVLLFVFIYFFERYQPSTRERAEPKPLFPQIAAGEIELLSITYGTNGATLAALKTNGTWFLAEPFYPARATPLDAFAEQLVNLRAYDRLSPNEVFIQGIANFGLEPPLARVRARAGTNQIELTVGRRTTVATNRVYLQKPPEPGVILSDSSILDQLPPSADAWRSRSLVHLDRGAFDALQIRTGPRLLELRRDPTNALWKITRPVPARADQNSVLRILEQITQTQVSEFVTNETTGLEIFGLQTPPLELAFLRGTNRLGTLHFGNTLTNQPQWIYARVPVYSNITVAPTQLASLLNQPYKAFHDPRLIDFPLQSLSRVRVQFAPPGLSPEKFTLEHAQSNQWSIVVGTNNFVADGELVNRFFNQLSLLQILDIAREVPGEKDITELGLSQPLLTMAGYRQETNSTGVTNVLQTEIQYGSNQVDSIFVRRTDEVPIYIGSFAEMLALSKGAFQFRDRQLWRIAPTNIVALHLTNQSTGRTIQRGPSGEWDADPIRHAAIEEMVFRISQARALEWVSKGMPRLRPFGLSPPQLSLAIRLADQPEPIYLHFGNQTARRDVYASTPMRGETEPIVFEFSGFQFQELLTQFGMRP